MKVYNSGAANNTITGNNRSSVSKDGFLKILSAQLQNQDPMNAKDNSEYVAQMAQFAALEQMQNLNDSMNNLLISQKINEGSLMIGRIVKIDNGDGTFVTGEVTGAKAGGKGLVNIMVDGKEYSTDNVVELVRNEEKERQLMEILNNILESQKESDVDVV